MKYRVKINRPIWGVPITLIENYNLEKFEILGIPQNKHLMDKTLEFGKEFTDMLKKQGNKSHISPGMHGVGIIESGKAKLVYLRVLIRSKNEIQD